MLALNLGLRTRFGQRVCCVGGGGVHKKRLDESKGEGGEGYEQLSFWVINLIY